MCWFRVLQILYLSGVNRPAKLNYLVPIPIVVSLLLDCAKWTNDCVNFMQSRQMQSVSLWSLWEYPRIAQPEPRDSATDSTVLSMSEYFCFSGQTCLDFGRQMPCFQCSEDLKSSRLCTQPNKTDLFGKTRELLFMVQAAACYVPTYNVTLITGYKLDQTPSLGRQLTLFLHFSCLNQKSLNILLFHTSQNHIQTWNNYLSKYRGAICLFIKHSFLSYKAYTLEFQWCFKLAKTDR